MRPVPPEQLASAQTVAQNGTISLSVFSAGFIVGAGGGEGTLTFAGQVYPITVGGIGIGMIGFGGGQMEGVAYNMRSPADSGHLRRSGRRVHTRRRRKSGAAAERERRHSTSPRRADWS